MKIKDYPYNFEKNNNKFLVDGTGLIKVRGVYYKNFKVLCEELNLSYQMFIQRKNHSNCVEYCIYPFNYPHKNTREENEELAISYFKELDKLNSNEEKEEIIETPKQTIQEMLNEEVNRRINNKEKIKLIKDKIEKFNTINILLNSIKNIF